MDGRAHVLKLTGCLLALGVAACADDPEDVATPIVTADAGTVDARVPDVVDGSAPVVVTQDAAAPRFDAGGGGSGCELGAAGSFATDQSLDLFGNVIYFAAGQSLPIGRYRVAYEDGCMKYNVFQPWTVNGVGTNGWWLVGDSASTRVVALPGTHFQLIGGGFADFAACVAGNMAEAPLEFDFTGGKLGIWLDDAPYEDNQAGEAGRNPKWKLTLLAEACPPDLVL